MSARTCSWTFLAVALLAILLTSAGCHTYYNCPIMQGMAGWTIQSPLPPQEAGDAYKVIGYRNGIRFYVIQYNAKLFRGGDILSKEGANTLKELGIKTVIAIDPSDAERALARESGFQYVEIPFEINTLGKAQLDRFLDTVDHGAGPFYVHDIGGDLKAGILAAHYRIHREGWTADKAIAEYYRLLGNFWDSLTMVQVLKDNAATK